MSARRVSLLILVVSAVLLALFFGPHWADTTRALPPAAPDEPGRVAHPLQCPDPPTDDIPWSAGYDGRDDVQAAFNAARAEENPALPEMTLPSATDWNAMTDGQKAMWLIRREQEDRGVLLMDSAEPHVTQAAEDYAEYLVVNDARGHTADGTFPDRLQRQGVSCNQRWNENITYHYNNHAPGDDEYEPFQLPIERAIYGWLYEDEDAEWGHRENILCHEFTDDVCPAGQEGFVGIGRFAGGPWTPPGIDWPGVEIVVMDAFDPCPSWPVFTSGAPPSPAQVNQDYSHTFTACGTPEPSFSVTSGTLPDGLELDEDTGELTGTPTTAGSWTFTVSASTGTLPDATQQVTIEVVGQAPVAPTITSGVPPGEAQVGTPYDHTFTATGNPAPTFSVTEGSLPPGLTLDENTGELTGTPTTAGSWTFTVTASNGVTPADSQEVTIDVEELDSPAFTSDLPGPGEVGAAYDHTFTAAGDPAPTFSVTEGDLPPGLTLDENTGELTGTPTTAGSYTFTVTASNGVTPDATQEVTIDIVEELVPPDIVIDPLPDARVREPYSETIEADGSPAPTFEVTEGRTPPGLELAPSGVISGTPTLPGSYGFEVTADNGVPPADSVDAVIVVAPAKPATYLPLVVRNKGATNWESEPNDWCLTEANGPIPSGAIYNGQFPTGDDLKDCYYFDMPSKHKVEIWLTNIPHEHDYDLLLSDKDLNEVERSSQLGTDSEHILTDALAAGRYYITVLNEGQSGSTQAYQLRVVYK